MDARTLLHESRESSLRSRRDAMSLVQQAISCDPADVLALATKGFYLYGERHQRNLEPLKQCVADCTRHLDGADAQSLRYYKALCAASEGNAMEMVFHLEQQLLADPTDIIALKLCQSELFWLGEMQWSASLSTSVAQHIHKDHRYYSDFLAIRAFDLEETGDYSQAEKLGRESVSINPADVWGAHAVTHVMYMQGRGAEGAQWLDTLYRGGHWEGLGQMVLHLWWHRALFHLINGEPDAALAVYDDYLRNFDIDMVESLPDLYLDLQNATSLLIRLEMLGISVGDRWSVLAGYCAERIQDTSNAFSSAHYAVVLAADQQFDKAAELIDSMRQMSRAGKSLSAGYHSAALPAALAAVAHRKREYGKVIETLMPARYQLVQMGGSHAQREVFLLILADALQAQGDTALLKKLSADFVATGFADIMANRIVAA